MPRGSQPNCSHEISPFIGEGRKLTQHTCHNIQNWCWTFFPKIKAQHTGSTESKNVHAKVHEINLLGMVGVGSTFSVLLETVTVVWDDRKRI